VYYGIQTLELGGQKNAYTLDLQQRIVATYQAGGTSIREVAKGFMVTRTSVYAIKQKILSHGLSWDLKYPLFAMSLA